MLTAVSQTRRQAIHRYASRTIVTGPLLTGIALLILALNAVDAALVDNLEAAWRFDETSGVFADVTGKYNATAVDDPYGNGSNGLMGGALDVFGGDAASAGTELGNYAVTDAFSASVWLNLRLINNSTFYSFLGKRVGGPAGDLQEGWSLRNGPSGARQAVRVQWFSNDGTNESGYAVQTSNAFLLDDDAGWQHIVMTHDGSSDLSGTKIYFNGALQGTSRTGTPLLSDTVAENEPFLVGWRANADGGAVNGHIDMTALWSRVLTADEVTLLYNDGKGLVVPEPASALLLALAATALLRRRR